MTNYHHFYLRTEALDEVCQEIKSHLQASSVGLVPIKVAIVGNGVVKPDRDERGSPVTTEEISEWYLLDVKFEYGSVEAQRLIRLFLTSHHVDLAAEDNEKEAVNRDSTAEVIDASHWLADATRKTPSEQLGLAVKIASEIHLGQFDRGGKPYILHPLHLMQQLLFDHELASIAVLHDVIEDGEGAVTIESLKQDGFSSRVCDALQLLTHKPGQEYLSEYIQGICTNYDAVRVKRKDLEHNSNITRLIGVGAKDLSRTEKYHKAFVMLGDAKLRFTST